MMLSILIPSRNEQFLKNTVDDILTNIEADTEVIVGLDGAWANPPLVQDDRVNIIYEPVSIGQRAITNNCARIAQGKYVMKVDAHCAFDKGFDRKMLEFFKEHGDDITAVPIMRNLWAFNWKCRKCGKKWYQGPTPTKCQETKFKLTGQPCESKSFTRKMMWVAKGNPQSWSYCFDSTPHFQYFDDYKNRVREQARDKGFTETMSLQGSCFMMTRQNYWDWEVCDEKAGSWGNQGIEVALATWLTGHRVLVNHRTYYAHMFRTQGGDFGFPYEQHGRQVKRTKDYIKDKFWEIKHPKQIHSVKWLLEKFWPVKGWSEEDLLCIK